MKFKSGFASLIGRPNVGKSTLMNNIIGEKIAIISNKPQTTRNKIQCVYTENDFQVVFLDTPGLHKPKNKLGEYMVDVAKSTLDEVDIIIWLVDDSTQIGPGDKYIYEEIKKLSTPKILVINKIDKMTKEEIEEAVQNYSELGEFEDIIPISALNGIGVEKLTNTIKRLLPEGPKYFPDDMITDQPERLIISEIIREKALHYLEQEVPHGVAVDIDLIKKREGKEIVDINATIYCEKESHKGIIIGKEGRKLKGIGKSARIDIERLLGSKVFLDLWVKVKKDWREKESALRYFSYK
ncbi:GTPase Era [Caldisalinibacter kiritimatiensis]|uniref:GTPase Era n=1 Tax=Caldisalinibacter kiritimatiensis TaxID=1304284 RepID=R1AXE6_9FIRM|nr:GTPase Era [Caldisalinibacter kiritimatiensis]EOD01873.1 GTP-binding protein Era [Caldisalinibacter kiritimatiensis]